MVIAVLLAGPPPSVVMLRCLFSITFRDGVATDGSWRRAAQPGQRTASRAPRARPRCAGQTSWQVSIAGAARRPCAPDLPGRVACDRLPADRAPGHAYAARPEEPGPE